jgi:acyl-CoA reductase-like NAD-dependent aldehyde dehydrogenase
MLAMNDEIVPELAWQMGRPTRYGGELRGFEERARHDRHRRAALSAIKPNPRTASAATSRREPLGRRLVIAPWNYPYLTAVNSIMPGADRRQCGHPQACRADDARRRAFCRSLGGGRAAARLSSRTSSSPRPDERELIGSGRVDHVNFTGSVAGGGDRARGGRHLHQCRARARRQGPGLCDGRRRLDFAVENLVDGAFFNSGQCCCGIERIYVHEKPLRRLRRRLRRPDQEVRARQPARRRRRRSARWRRTFADLVREQIASAKRKGATALVDMNFSRTTAPARPTSPRRSLTGVNHQMSVMTEESFGRSSAS